MPRYRLAWGWRPRRRNLLSGRLLRPAFHQLAELKFELVQQNGGALGGISEPGVPEFGDLELEVLDPGIEIADAPVFLD